jgi:uncharacterized caspase-like protein
VRSRRAFRDVVQSFVKTLNPADTVLIYFAGHGMQSGNENYLLPIDIDPASVADIEEDGISLRYLLRTLEEARSGPNIVILDACRENILSGKRSWLSHGLAATDPPKDTLLVYATAPNEYAYDNVGKNSPNGLFAKHLLVHMEEPGITAEQLFGIVAGSVLKEARANNLYQLPYRNSALSSTFCLAGCDSPATAKEMEQISQRNAELNTQLEEIRAKYNQRESEIAQFAELKAKYSQSEAELLALHKKNAERDANIAKLAMRIQELQRDSESAGATAKEREPELARLRSELATIQQMRQRDAARLEQQNIGLAKELSELRARELESQKLTQEVDRYRRQVVELQKARDDLQRQPSKSADTLNRPRIIVPSF